MNKVVKEEVVTRDQNIVQHIINLATECKSWVFVSHELYQHLSNQIYYHYEDFPNQDGKFFTDKAGKKIGIKIASKNFCPHFWCQVELINQGQTLISGDPDVIYFLSWVGFKPTANVLENNCTQWHWQFLWNIFTYIFNILLL